MAIINVSLPDRMKEWVETQSKVGHYRTASDYVRDLIRKDQERRTAVAALQDAITEGAESGRPETFDASAFKLRMRERHVVK